MAIALLCSSATPARADIAVESRSVRELSDAERSAMYRLKNDLQRRGVTTKPEQVLEQARMYLPLPAYPERAVTRTELLERLLTAENIAAHARYEEAVAMLESILRDLDRNPAIAATDPDSRIWMTRVRATLANAYIRGKKPNLKRANDLVMEQVRSYPVLPFADAQEEVVKLYEALKPTISQMPRGKLIFRTNHVGAEISVNAVARGRGSVEVSLLPGEYCAVVRVGNAHRSYRFVVRANEATERTVDWPLDVEFDAGSDWIGFGAKASWRSTTSFLQEVARQTSGQAVILIGVMQHDDRRYLVARRYSATSTLPVGRAVEIGSADDALIDALAAYIVAPGAESKLPAADGLVPIPADDAAPPQAAQVASGIAAKRPPRWPVLAATAVVITTVPLGSYFLKLRNDCYTGDCSRLTTTGVSLLAAGGAALVFEIAWIIYVERASASAPAIGVLPVPGGGVASWVGRF